MREILLGMVLQAVIDQLVCGLAHAARELLTELRGGERRLVRVGGPSAEASVLFVVVQYPAAAGGPRLPSLGVSRLHQLSDLKGVRPEPGLPWWVAST